MINQITVWTTLGPWMKLVDIFVLQKAMDKEKVQEIVLMKFRERVRRIKTLAQGEKALKQYLFGKYLYTPPIGAYTDHYIDRPLPSSSATPFPDGKVMFDDIKITKAIYGSRLDIDMTPRSVHTNEDESPPEVEPLVSDEITALSTQNTGQSYDAIPTEEV